jgi:hypothetical protein
MSTFLSTAENVMNMDISFRISLKYSPVHTLRKRKVRKKRALPKYRDARNLILKKSGQDKEKILQPTTLLTFSTNCLIPRRWKTRTNMKTEKAPRVKPNKFKNQSWSR